LDYLDAVDLAIVEINFDLLAKLILVNAADALLGDD